MDISDSHAEARREWLREEQQPKIHQHTPQSNFEDSLQWKIGLLFAAIAIGILLFSPDPDLTAATAHPTARASV